MELTDLQKGDRVLLDKDDRLYRGYGARSASVAYIDEGWAVKLDHILDENGESIDVAGYHAPAKSVHSIISRAKPIPKTYSIWN